MRRRLMMKIFWITLASLAMMGFQPVMAYEDTLPGQLDAGKNQATRQGQENGQLQRGTANNVPPKPWETRPWEQAQKDVRPGGLRQNDAQKAEEVRRVGRKARKERLERQKEKAQTLSYQERVKQRQTKWQRHQLGSERYVSGAVPQK
jgi:hypothetical protein